MLSELDVAVPRSLAEATALLAANPEDSLVLAGGQSLLILVRQGLVAPAMLVDLHSIPDLAGVRAAGEIVRVGAMTTYQELTAHPHVPPVLARAAGSVGSVHIRNRGTVGGSLVHCDPAGDVPTVLLALGATVTLVSDTEGRELPLDGFFRGLFETTRDSGEVLTRASVPVPTESATTGYARFCFRAGEYPLCVAACRLDWAGGMCTAARVAVGGGFDHPVRVPEVEALMVGDDGADVEAVLSGIRALFAPISDVRGSAAWKARVVERTVIAAVAEAAA